MNNLFKNVCVGVTADTALEILKDGSFEGYSIAVSIPFNNLLLEELYIKLVDNRQQKIIFLLPEEGIEAHQLDCFARFFFLTNYCFKENAPVLIFRSAISLENSVIISQWCLAQGFDEPIYIPVDDLSETDSDSSNYVYVSTEMQETFLSLLIKRILAMEWLSKRFVFHVSNKSEFEKLLKAFEDLARLLEGNYPGVYAVLATLTKLEGELQKSMTMIRFQEIEINNQKLYNSLIRGGFQVDNTTSASTGESNTIDVEKLKNDCARLFMEIGRLRNDLAWYKRTYEERSLFGIVKEKLLKNEKKIQRKNLFRRLGI